MKIAILSGGSGNDALVRGIKKFSIDSDITVITNAYDSGKSTGICRHLYDKLGVSDIRKNHYRMYESMANVVRPEFKAFFEGRYDLHRENLFDELISLFEELGFGEYANFVKAAEDFSARVEKSDLTDNDLKSFNLANIVYSYFYSTVGYEEANKYFCNLLRIKDFVKINSDENIYIKAITEKSNIIQTEGDLVAFNSSEKIVDVDFFKDENPISIDEYKNKSVNEYKLNEETVDVLKEADVIIISTGTFWSSIYPTLKYGKLYNVINESKAMKFWIMNNEYDLDSLDVSDKELYARLENLGLEIEKFTILENMSSISQLHTMAGASNVVYQDFENNKGKHNSEKVARTILKMIYKLNDSYNYYGFDFDDTLKARDNSNYEVYIENMEMVDKLKDKGIIISGNNYESLGYLAHNLKNTTIWADAFSTKFKGGKALETLKESMIPKEHCDKICEFVTFLGLGDKISIKPSKTVIKIKPVDSKYRPVLTWALNTFFKNIGADVKAYMTGYTTIDILTSNASKKNIATKYDNLYYIGDEIDSGNDRSVVEVAKTAIKVSSITETNCILKLITEGL